jgi:hypothetical protein
MNTNASRDEAPKKERRPRAKKTANPISDPTPTVVEGEAAKSENEFALVPAKKPKKGSQWVNLSDDEKRQKRIEQAATARAKKQARKDAEEGVIDQKAVLAAPVAQEEVIEGEIVSETIESEIAKLPVPSGDEIRATGTAIVEFHSGKTNSLSLPDVLKSVETAILPDANPSIRMLITPEIAKGFLARNVNNRNLSNNHAQWFARIIEQGDWDPNNGETIKFSKTGNLLDGQHRLEGIVLSNTSVVMEVKFNLDETSQQTMDVGRVRKIGDQLAVTGEVNGARLAAAIRWTYAIANGVTAYKLSSTEAVNFLKAHPNLRDSVRRVREAQGKAQVPITIPSLMMAVHFIACEALREQDRAEAFVNVFASGHREYEGDPAHIAREYLAGAKLKRVSLSQAVQLEVLIHAWNLFRAGKAVKVLRAPTNPSIDGFDPAVLGITVHQNKPIRSVKLETGAKIYLPASDKAA